MVNLPSYSELEELAKFDLNRYHYDAMGISASFILYCSEGDYRFNEYKAAYMAAGGVGLTINTADDLIDGDRELQTSISDKYLLEELRRALQGGSTDLQESPEVDIIRMAKRVSEIGLEEKFHQISNQLVDEVTREEDYEHHLRAGETVLEAQLYIVESVTSYESKNSDVEYWREVGRLFQINDDLIDRDRPEAFKYESEKKDLEQWLKQHERSGSNFLYHLSDNGVSAGRNIKRLLGRE